MNKNAVYLAVFGVLCVLTGVVVGAGIAKKVDFPYLSSKRPNFTEKAERFMWHRSKDFKAPKDFRARGGRGKERLFTMLTDKLELNQEQQVKVKAIMEETRREISQVGKDVRQSIDTIKEKSNQKIMEVLTPQQQEKFKTLGPSRSKMGRRSHSRKIWSKKYGKED